MSHKAEGKDRILSDFEFRLMSLEYKVRDLLSPPSRLLTETGIKAGDSVLDYGCGPGRYTVALSALVGIAGKVYALDAHPLAIRKIQRLKDKRRLFNVVTIFSDCATGLPDRCLDAALLYDILHDLAHAGRVLGEISRTLKSGGILYVKDHHLQEDEVISSICQAGNFKLDRKGRGVFAFVSLV
jgi:ubiquinone/menaquinone biosynthesis C-methylase UbiE